MALAAVAIYRKGFGLTFFYDEWAFIFDRRDWSPGSFLEPHGEHIAIVPAAVYKVLFLAVGLEEYRAYRSVVLLIHLACVVLVYLLARQSRVARARGHRGDRDPRARIRLAEPPMALPDRVS